jgi:alanine-glyoxylate transaminase/serine-glyoxylate transaminase/serine-pyruvate transaminase
VVHVEDPWGRAVSPEKLEAALKAHPAAKAVAFVHAETSTGVLSDAETLAALARAHGCLTIVDTVTSLGGSPLYVDAWGLDAVYSGSQKCLSCTPGLSPITFGSRAVDAVQNRRTPVQSWFMDVSLVIGYWGAGTKRSYHHTAPTRVPPVGKTCEPLSSFTDSIVSASLRHRRGMSHSRSSCGV